MNCKMLWAAAAAAVIAAPLQATAFDQSAVQPGAFAGARFQLALGGKTGAQPRASLTIAPTQSRISNNGMIRTRIGDGIALNLTGREKPTITLAGVRADEALGLTAQRMRDPDNKSGLSTAGWVAIGVGTVLVAGAVAFALWVDAIEDNED